MFVFEVQAMKKVAILMGSDSDLAVMKGAMDALDRLAIAYEARVLSAHRTPALAQKFACEARANGFGAIICAAGKAAHLAGAIAANTTLPVIGVPINSSLEGLDALLSTVQMPPGIPVATVAIDGAMNAALLAAQILAVSDAALMEKLEADRASMAQRVLEKDRAIQMQFGGGNQDG
jgi:5-(carboxyamino)imidazole ribonucleotide mutase